ncbi:MAG: hypothetical protein IPK80_24705 [Nannocystis sp.]|nr:hypothetical protein [Nannocystis sp.]
MSIDRCWAARYEFLRELWDGRDRLLVDEALAALVATPRRTHGALGEMVQALTGERGRGRAWLLGEVGRTSAGRRQRGLEVIDSAATSSLTELPWEVALVDLDGFLGEGSAPSRMLRRDLPGVWRHLDRRAIGLLDALAEAASRGRAVVLSISADKARAPDFQVLVEHCFDRARLFGVAPMPVVGIVDFGEIARDDDGRGQGDASVALAFDNSLAAEVPAFAAYVAVIGRPFAGGITLVEVEGEGGEAEGSGEQSGLRAQLTQALAQVEAGAAARLSLVEQLDAAQRRIAALEGQRAALAAQQAAGAWEATRGEGAEERVELLRATVLTLRWELEKARAEIDRLVQRPVAAIEAELASLRAQVAAAVGVAASASE